MTLRAMPSPAWSRAARSARNPGHSPERYGGSALAARKL